MPVGQFPNKHYCFYKRSYKTESETFKSLSFARWRRMETACRELWYVLQRDPLSWQENHQPVRRCSWSYCETPLFDGWGTLRQTRHERTSRISRLTINYDKPFVIILIQVHVQLSWSARQSYRIIQIQYNTIEYTVRPKTKVKYVGTTFKGILSIDLTTVSFF